MVALKMIVLTLVAASIDANSNSLRNGRDKGRITHAYADRNDRDSILDWNLIALDAVAQDVSGTFGLPEQNGPTRAARALAVVHAAMFDAYNSIDHIAAPVLTFIDSPEASIEAAVSTAAHSTLLALYPSQASVINAAYESYHAAIPDCSSKQLGIDLGNTIAKAMLDAHTDDGNDAAIVYVPSGNPGNHNVDPLNPTQGFLNPNWGFVKPFCMKSAMQHEFVSTPPALGSEEYAEAFKEVKTLGALGGDSSPTTRTAYDTITGVFWGYDNPKNIGPPPRLYNQVVRAVAIQQHNTEAQNARLFALVNLAMADGAVTTWATKFTSNMWRPVLGIRGAAEDGNPGTVANKEWKPFGAQRSNCGGIPFTPNFPAYTSGHSQFGGCIFAILEKFYGTDDVPFTFVSDEFNGITTNGEPNANGICEVRPRVERNYSKFSEASLENALSRVYLGVHWRFDCIDGMKSGKHIGTYIYDNILQLIK